MSFWGSSSSNPKPSSSSRSRRKVYDVFLTFRTKCDATRCLQASLKDEATIRTFVDEGEEMTPRVLRGMEGSEIVVIVFTPELVTSWRCLMKIEEIMSYKSAKYEAVLPVFCFRYGYRPTRSYRFIELFERLVAGIKDRELRKRWARSVAGAGLTLRPGWGMNMSTSDSHDIKDIVYSIRMLKRGHLALPRYSVGIKLRVKEATHPIYKAQNKKKLNIIGIWGTGGIGKTTIAKAIYNEFNDPPMSRSFLENIKNEWEKDKGPIYLQKKFFSDLSNKKFEEIHDTEIGIRQLKTILKDKIALIILDDVSHVDQVMALCGNGEWLCLGSWMIITTRNKHVLDQLDVDHVYEMKKMDKSESLELFIHHACVELHPTDGFSKLSREVINYCEGLPLVLEVIGSLLHNRSIQEWERVLEKLKGIPNGEIKEKLITSYDFLTDSEKDLFRNMCSCLGLWEHNLAQMFDDSKLPIESGIRILTSFIKRSLLKVDMSGKFQVHDLLQEIGKGVNPNKPKPKYIYDIFLSFRGEDTRKSFATHLYTALSQAGIKVFMDNSLQRGKNITSSLLQAIESSNISIIIFSENYAGSKWCLEELEKIMECHRTTGQEVLPIFYGVQPTEIRKQINAVGKALEGISASKDKKLTWKRVLTEAANLSGLDLHNYRTETELIGNILETVNMKLDSSTFLFVAHHPVGLKSRVEDIIQLLSTSLNEVIIVGIWGMGGIGKTTIAKAIYNEIGKNFECKSFLTNIREVWKQDNGQVYLQEQLLSGILKTRRMTLPSIELGKTIMKESLQHKRALIVFDDVNNEDQLKALCGSREWFGRGSRIIITTRDKYLLKFLEVDDVYNVKEMDHNESLEHFSWHAFKQAIPERDLFELSRSIVSYCGGLPLALEILGSYLFDREILQWESVLEKLQEIGNDQIHEKLKISYDGLSDKTEKDIFLDICCFFIGKDRKYVTQILNGCGLHAEIGITRLIERSLVKVDKNNKLDMHDLIRDMGRKIIREESLEEPEKRTRLWFHKDVLDVLRNNIGTMATKGLALNMSRNNSLSLSTKSFQNMRRLRLLQLGQIKLSGDYKDLSKELRWLCWHGFALDNMPMDLCQEKIVVIDLKYSNLTQAWKKNQLLEWLKILNLSHSHYLTQTPDFSKLPSLEKLILKDCPSLTMVHPTIGDLKYLSVLNLKDCKDLSHLPGSIYKLKSLKTLNLSGCSKIDKLEEGIDQMESLTTLLANQMAITQVPFTLVRSKSIKYVSLGGYEGLSCDVFPSLISSWMSPRSHPKSMIRSFGNIPYLLQGLSRRLLSISGAILKTRPSTSQISSRKTLASIDLPEQVHMAGSENFMSSLTIHVGASNKVIDTLLGSISQGWSEGGFDGNSLPGDNYPDWLNFKGEGSSILFKVPQVIGSSLKGLILCIVYLSPQDSMSSVYPVGIMISNRTRNTIDFCKRDAVNTSNDEEWQNIISSLKPNDEVEIMITFARKFIVKKTLLYLVYGEDVHKRIML